MFSPNPLQSLKRAAPLGAEGVQTAAGPQQKRARGAVVDIGTHSTRLTCLRSRQPSTCLMIVGRAQRVSGRPRPRTCCQRKRFRAPWLSSPSPCLEIPPHSLQTQHRRRDGTSKPRFQASTWLRASRRRRQIRALRGRGAREGRDVRGPRSTMRWSGCCGWRASIRLLLQGVKQQPRGMVREGGRAAREGRRTPMSHERVSLLSLEPLLTRGRLRLRHQQRHRQHIIPPPVLVNPALPGAGTDGQRALRRSDVS